MHYKTNRQNHDFQIAYFIAGSCQTPDAAYSILCDLKEDRTLALKNAEASSLRERIKVLRATALIASDNEEERLEAQADLLEIKAFAPLVQANVDACAAELKTIDKCIAILQPLRKYSQLPDAQAHEAAQAEEWKLQLIFDAENQLVCTGCINTDHFAVMRLHPAFASYIMPALEETQKLIESHRGSADYTTIMTKRLTRNAAFKALLHEAVPKLESSIAQELLS